MSEYQYLEFQAVDRPLDEADREALRAMSSRARITATGFTNHYNWSDFGGDPRKLMARWFDLHLYLANWGTRQFMIRLPKRLMDRSRLDSLLHDCNWAEIFEAGDCLILDICEDGEPEDYDGDDGSGWLAALAPLRADLLSGDLRLLYLLWLSEVEFGGRKDGETEPLPGIGPLTGALRAFAEFFRIDSGLVEAAAEAHGGIADGELPVDAIGAAVAAMSEDEKAELLRRAAEGDPHVGAEIRRRARIAASSEDSAMHTARRTVSDLRRRAAAIHEEKEAAEAERREAERLRQEREAEEAQRARVAALRQRGEAVWDEIESEADRRHASGYDRAAALLSDLKALAEEDDAAAAFTDRLNDIRLRHSRKWGFIRRLEEL
ncbi:MAG: hypothetical protein OXG99_17870 [Alphaproteobacteria bacterium]|nr:hypothetical protein [Alphaproteobacteria bacterium]